MSGYNPNLTNLLTAIQSPEQCGFEVSWRPGIGYRSGSPLIRVMGEQGWRRADTGNGLTIARIQLEKHGFRTPAKGITADVIRLVALEQREADHG